MQVFDTEAETLPPDDDPRREDWGEDCIVFSSPDETAEWIMFDEELEENLTDWR